MPNVDVVIANYEGADVLPACLESLAGQTLRPSTVIVCDAGSLDRSAEVARAHGASVIVGANLGLGRLYNLGARAATAEFVLLANNDLALEPRCLELLADALVAEPERFAADPTQLDWAGSRRIHARTVLRRGPLMRTPIPGLVVETNVGGKGIERTVCANAGAMLVRRDRLLELGGFDETFFLDFEDLDLCWRAWARGWESVWVADAVVRHRVGASASPTVSPRRLAASHHNLLRFAIKCLPAGPAARVVAGELVRLPVHPRPIATSLVRVARSLPEILRARRAAAPHGPLYRWLLGSLDGAPPARRR